MGKKFKQIIKLLSIATLTCVLLFGVLNITAKASGGNWNAEKQNKGDDWWKWWNQWDTVHGSGSAMYLAGCRIVSLTKLLVDVGAINDPSSYTPDDFFSWGKENGYFDNGCNANGYVGASAEAFAEKHGVKLVRDRTRVEINTKTQDGLNRAKQTIRDYLDKDYYLLIGYDYTVIVNGEKVHKMHWDYIDRERSNGTDIYIATTGNNEGVCRLEDCNKEGSVNYYKKFTNLYLFKVDGWGKTEGKIKWDLSKDGTLNISGSGDTGDLYNCRRYAESIKKVIISGHITSIGRSAFDHCTNLKNITIPNSVTDIKTFAFSGCDSLTSITIPNSVTEIGNRAFFYCDSLESITLPNSVKSIGKSAFYRCKSLKSITIPNSVTEIGEDAFRFCENLKSVTISNAVKSIGKDTFDSCTNLKNITIPNSVKSIGEHAFQGCESLKSVIIPNSVTSIGNFAFADCKSLKSITIPDSVTEIGTGAFNNVSNCTITFEGTKQQWNSLEESVDVKLNKTCKVICQGNSYQIVFNGNGATSGKMKAVDVPAGGNVKIPKNTFKKNGYKFQYWQYSLGNQCYKVDDGTYAKISQKTLKNNNVRSLELIAIWKKEKPTPAAKGTKISIGGVQYVVSSSSKSNPTLKVTAVSSKNTKSVTIPYSYTSKNKVTYKITQIDKNAFKGNKKITKVSIGDNVTEIGDNAFYGCSGIKTLTLGKGVKKIGAKAFYGCAGIKKLTMDDAVENIGAKAFYNCQGMTSLTLSRNTTKLGNQFAEMCIDLKTITISSTALKNSGISSNAFKGVGATIKVPKSKLKEYTKLFRKKGLNKNVKIIGVNFSSGGGGNGSIGGGGAGGGFR